MMAAFLLLLLCVNFTGCYSQESSGTNNTVCIPANTLLDSIVVFKAKRKMTVFSNSREIKTYTIALGKNPVGKKRFEGDYKTPEGLYFIDAKSAASQYHKNLNISYPNKEDLRYAAAQKKKAGGDIKIHGLPNGMEDKDYVRTDWTWGCIALTNKEIEEVFGHIRIGSPILILP